MTFAETVKHYASCGMSMRATACVLGVPYDKFKGLVRDEGLRHLFVEAHYSRDCNGGGGGWPKGVSRPFRVRISADNILLELRRFPDTTSFRALADINTSTVERRLGPLPVAHRFARSSSPADPTWRFVAECADGGRLSSVSPIADERILS